MSSIVPDAVAYDGPAADLPPVEPELHDLAAIAWLGDEADELVDEHLLQIDASLARYGHVDELLRRRHRRAVGAALRESVDAAAARRGGAA